MFRIEVRIRGFKQLFRNIYKSENDYILGVAELEYEILFFTLQLPLSSLLHEVFVITLTNKKHDIILKQFVI